MSCSADVIALRVHVPKIVHTLGFRYLYRDYYLEVKVKYILYEYMDP